MQTEYIKSRAEATPTILFYDFWCSLIKEFFKNKEDETGVLVELMCGRAEYLMRLSGRNPKHTRIGIDSDWKILQAGVFKMDLRYSLVQGDCRHLPLPNNKINAVVIMGGLHHVARYQGKVLSELSRVMSSGGVLVISEPRNDNPLIRAARYVVYRLFNAFDPKEEKGLNIHDLSREMGRYGFEPISFLPFGFIAYPLLGNSDIIRFVAHIRSPWLINGLISIDKCLSKVPIIKSFSWAFVASFRKGQ